MRFFRKSDEEEKPKDATPELPKASIRQLWRYAQGFDLFMVVLGGIVALITGAGLPAMTIVLGNISQSFVKANILLYDPSYMVSTSDGLVPFNATYSFDDFRSEMIQNCVIYVIIGVVIFIAAFTQVMCFLVSCENMIHRMRKAFFRAILRQDIPYFDKTATGTLTTKIFE
ncbi:CBN-PGP-9 protein [Aphelenchoides avenae]|nr:CBN-PGP-9 protein [Aphelenchus avenae]